MTTETKKKKELTELQQKFLDVVMDDVHKGNIREAMRTAGYSETAPTSVVIKALSEELIEIARQTVAANAPKAVFATLGVLDNGAELGAANKLKAAQSILDRAGVKSKDDSEDINLKVPSGGLIILPAKEVERDVDEEGRDSNQT